MSRRVARKEAGSANEKRAKEKLRRLHGAIADQRRHYLHNCSTQLAQDPRRALFRDVVGGEHGEEPLPLSVDCRRFLGGVRPHHRLQSGVVWDGHCLCAEVLSLDEDLLIVWVGSGTTSAVRPHFFMPPLRAVIDRDRDAAVDLAASANAERSSASRAPDRSARPGYRCLWRIGADRHQGDGGNRSRDGSRRAGKEQEPAIAATSPA